LHELTSPPVHPPQVLLDQKTDSSYGALNLAGSARGNRKGDGRRSDNNFSKHMELRRAVGIDARGLGERVNSSDRFSPTMSDSRNDGNTSTPTNIATPTRTKGFGTSLRRMSLGKLGSGSKSAIKPVAVPPAVTTSSPPAGGRSPIAQSPVKTGGVGSSANSPSNERYWDDHTRCNVCEKKFKVVTRCRHNCARCLSAFCHKHGRTTHSNFTSCRVPGSCICNMCLDVEHFNMTAAATPSS